MKFNRYSITLKIIGESIGSIWDGRTWTAQLYIVLKSYFLDWIQDQEGIRHGIMEKWNDHILPPDLPTPWRSCIGWLTPDNARVYKNGKQAHWWDDKAKLHNLLPNTMCRLLCEIYHKEQESLTKEELTEFFNKHVMVTNISPLVTEDLIALKNCIANLTRVRLGRKRRVFFLTILYALLIWSNRNSLFILVNTRRIWFIRIFWTGVFLQ